MSGASALVVAVPLGLAAAVSPVMLAEQMVLVAGPRGRRAATAYALGTVVVLVALTSVLLVLGRSVSLPRAPRLDSTLDLVLGSVLLLVAAQLARRGRSGRPGPVDGEHSEPESGRAGGATGRLGPGSGSSRHGTARPGRGTGPSGHGTGPVRTRSGMRPIEAFGFGVLSMATDFTSLPIVVVADKDIAASSSAWPVKLLAVLVLVVLTTAPAWAPVAAAAAPGPTAQAALAAVSTFIARQGPRIATLAAGLIGAVLVLRGLVSASGLWS